MLSLPTALRLDAIVSGANGAAYLVAAGPIGDLLGLSPALLRGAGAVLLAFAALVWLAASPLSGPSRAGTAAVIAMNAAWAAGSLLAAVAQWGTPATAGTLWIVVQAIVVAGFAELQLTALRRPPRAATVTA